MLAGSLPARGATFTSIAKGDIIASLANGQVNEYSPSGTLVQTLISDANTPTGSAFDGAGNLYVTEFNGDDILKVNGSTGAVSVFSNNSILGDGTSFDAPESIAFGPGYKDMYVSDANRNGPGGGIHIIDTATGKGAGFLPLPSSSGSEGAGESDWLAFNHSGTLFMTNENPSQGIMQVDQSSKDIVQPSFVPNLPKYGYALSFDANGNLWLSDTSSILEYDPSGKLINTITNPSFQTVFSAVFNPPYNTVYAGDLSSGSIFTYDLQGKLLNTFNIGSGVDGLSVAGTIVAPSSARYVALGDSVPYGHGLANPTKGTKSGLPAEQPPSTQAWPSVVDAGLPGLAPLQDRQDSCDLTGSNGTYFDQLAVSGAPSIDNKWSGLDTDCHYPKGVKVAPHKALFPNEVSAANLHNNPPGLVTIQVGADDIDFAACLESLLQIPVNPFMHVENCVDQTNKGYKVTNKVQTELASLAQGLSDTIQYVRNNAPSAQIVLVGYYQIIPTADATLQGTTFVCRDLRFSAKNSEWRTSIRAQGEFLQQQLNNTIKSVASKYPGVAYFDISNLFQGHEMCTPDTWLFSDDWDAAHPNAAGQQQIGQAVIADCEKLANHCIG